jgi:alkanesulfonate monooxygenase SsuD/methylene tetrahydromethanopterin reductase-like flavin-dependent oxidoreductase (luciferase family)
VKASLFCNCRYAGPATEGTWPVPADPYSSDTAQRTLQLALDQARLADQTGFDWVSVAEHHYAPFSITPNPMVMAGALTQVVRRAKIALLGPDVPILNPVRVAEEFAMLDTMSGGRVIAGMMRGTPNEYVTYNINPDESRERFMEALHLIKMAWTEEQPFGWQGRYYQYRSVSIWPRPVQKPHPPIYMSGSTPESGRFAAENRFGLGFAVTTVPAATKAANYYREQANVLGWRATPDDVIYRLGFHVAETDDAALDDLKAMAGRRSLASISLMNKAVAEAVAGSSYFGKAENYEHERRATAYDLKERIELGQVLVGAPGTVLAQIERIKVELDPGILDLTIIAQLGDKTLRSIELMGTKVLPRMHEL